MYSHPNFRKNFSSFNSNRKQSRVWVQSIHVPTALEWQSLLFWGCSLEVSVALGKAAWNHGPAPSTPDIRFQEGPIFWLSLCRELTRIRGRLLEKISRVFLVRLPPFRAGPCNPDHCNWFPSTRVPVPRGSNVSLAQYILLTYKFLPCGGP